MRNWQRLALCAVVGVLLGAGGAVWSVRAGSLGAQTVIGPWVTGSDFGTSAASRYTRAVIALRGLLALPATEARYYNASTDDQGAPLDGKCQYRLSGGALPAKWWSVTLYDPAGYLVPNPASVYSIGSAGLPPAERSHWQVIIGPNRVAGHWLPSGGISRFELTLRAYLPAGGGRGNFTAAQLPRLTRTGCA